MAKANLYEVENLKTNTSSAVFSGGAGGARAPPEFEGSQKGQSLISAHQSLAINLNAYALNPPPLKMPRPQKRPL